MTKRITPEKPPPVEHCCRCGRAKNDHITVSLEDHKVTRLCPTATFELDTLQQAMEDVD